MAGAPLAFHTGECDNLNANTIPPSALEVDRPKATGTQDHVVCAESENPRAKLQGYNTLRLQGSSDSVSSSSQRDDNRIYFRGWGQGESCV